MTESRLCQFIDECGIEWNWDKKEGKDDVILFIYIWDLEEFGLMIQDISDEEPTSLWFKGDYACVWMQDICDCFNIESEKVFKKS